MDLSGILEGMPKRKTAGQRKKSHENLKRQPGSLKVWLNETNGYVHETVQVHHGRVTRPYIGPEAKTLDIAHQFMSLDLKELG